MTTSARRWVVFDDDPTGTQTVSGVAVILRPTKQAFRRFLESGRPAVYVLTNTRAMKEADAVAYLRQLKALMDGEAASLGLEVGYVLRGDSTLRGHVFAEMNAVREKDAVGLFVPAFPECGRVTAGGVHYLVVSGERIPTADTEFARDPVFGYKSRTLTDWVAEKGPGWTPALVPLERLRTEGPAAVAEALLGAGPRTVVIPDAETVDDVRTIAAGLAEAERAGARVTVRSASTFAAVRCGLEARQLAGVPGDEPGRLLVVCGSHTAASTRQLERLTRRIGAEPVVVPTARLFAEGPSVIVRELAGRLAEQLESRGIAVLASERIRDSGHGDLIDGAKVMDSLVGIVKAVAAKCDAVVSKGGITSAQIASDGLMADEAEVCGQLEAGISLWRLRKPDGSRMWYTVVPGNVGDDGTMERIAGAVKSSLFQ